MTGEEYLIAYFALMQEGYTSDEAKEIIEDIKEKMEQTKE